MEGGLIEAPVLEALSNPLTVSRRHEEKVFRSDISVGESGIVKSLESKKGLGEEVDDCFLGDEFFLLLVLFQKIFESLLGGVEHQNKFQTC